MRHALATRKSATRDPTIALPSDSYARLGGNTFSFRKLITDMTVTGAASIRGIRRRLEWLLLPFFFIIIFRGF